MAGLRQSVPDSIEYSVSGMDGLLPSVETQEKSLDMWQEFWQRHADLAEQVKADAVKAGFTENAFERFTDGIDKDYQPLSESEMEPLTALCGNYMLQHDSLARVVNFVRVPMEASETMKDQVRQIMTSKDGPSTLRQAQGSGTCINQGP